MAKSNLRRVLKTISFADWLVLYLVARNIDMALFTKLATQIDPPGFGYYAMEDDDSDDNNNWKETSLFPLTFAVHWIVNEHHNCIDIVWRNQ